MQGTAYFKRQPYKTINQIVLMCDVRLLQWWCTENFILLGLLDLDDGTDRLFLSVGNQLTRGLHNI